MNPRINTHSRYLKSNKRLKKGKILEIEMKKIYKVFKKKWHTIDRQRSNIQVIEVLKEENQIKRINTKNYNLGKLSWNKKDLKPHIEILTSPRISTQNE